MDLPETAVILGIESPSFDPQGARSRVSMFFRPCYPHLMTSSFIHSLHRLMACRESTHSMGVLLIDLQILGRRGFHILLTHTSIYPNIHLWHGSKYRSFSSCVAPHDLLVIKVGYFCLVGPASWLLLLFRGSGVHFLLFMGCSRYSGICSLSPLSRFAS